MKLGFKKKDTLMKMSESVNQDTTSPVKIEDVDETPMSMNKS